MSTQTDKTSRWFGPCDETSDLPVQVVAGLGTLAALLVGASTFTAVQAGFPSVGIGFLAAVVLFVTTLVVFKAGRRFGR